MVGNDHRWISNGAGPHWLEVRFPLVVTLGSAQLFLGKDDTLTNASFQLEYRSGGGSWLAIPGATFAGNTANELNIVFSQSVQTDRVRFYTTENAARIKELALYAPNSGSGYPVGTDVTLNVAKHRYADASSRWSTSYAKFAVDGYVDDDSRWLSNNGAGPHTLELELVTTTKLGSAHLYSGFGTPTQGVVADFHLEFWDGAQWLQIPGSNVTGNSSDAVQVNFTAPISTNRVRLVSPNNGYTRVRELVLLPHNGGAGYPIGTDVVFDAPPSERFTEYHDDFYGLRNRAANVGVRGGVTAPTLEDLPASENANQFQMLLNVGTDTYRIRNRATGSCLEVAGASKQAGAAVREVDYTAMPHQQWRLETTNGAFRRIVNVWSGMALDVAGGVATGGAALVQQSVSTAFTQEWLIYSITHYPKKGLAGWEGRSGAIGAKWTYNWGLGSGSGLPFDTNFAPMRWGNHGWGSLPRRFPGWQRRNKPTMLMGFNEPDNSTQSNIPVSRALELWPRLEAAQMPLVSPGFTNAWNNWSQSFMDGARDRGYRQEYTALHWYSAPNPDAFMSHLSGIRNRYGKPVWITEWSNVDWNGSGNWNHEDNYTFLAEVLHRMEAANWLRRYSIFVFSGSATSKRSNFYLSGNQTLTPFGELYTAWDGDLTVREELQYHFHNKASHRHMQSSPGAAGPVGATIFNKDATVQWVTRSAGPGVYHIVSVADGRMLASDGVNPYLASSLTAGPDVEWRRVASSHGWYHFDDVTNNRRLRDNPAGGFELVSTTTSWDSTKFRFIKALEPVTPFVETLYGVGCGPASIQLQSTPTAGGSADLLFFGGDPGAPAAFLIAAASANTPLDLIGLNGCYANVDVGGGFIAAVPGVTSPIATWVLNLPIGPTFQGTVYGQFAFTNVGLNPLNIGTTQGARIIVR